MTVLSAVQAAAPKIGIAVPAALFSGTDNTSVAMQAMVNDCAATIRDEYDWQRLKTINTITGDGSTTDWSLPADYARMLKKATLWPSAQPNSPILHVTDSDQWLMEDVQAFQTVIARWTIYANQLHIKPAVASAATVKHFYISSYVVIASGGTAPTKATFTADTDSLFVDERILTLCIVWKWKAARGRPYAEDMAEYQAALDTATGNDKGSRILHLGRPRIPSDVTLAYPGVITP